MRIFETLSLFSKLSNVISAFKRARVWGIKGVLDFATRTWRERRIRRFLVKNARQHPGVPTESGITIIAPFSGSYSLSKTVRDFARALQKAHIAFQAVDTYVSTSRAAVSDYADLLTAPSDFNINRFSHIVEMFKSPLPDGLLPWAHGARRARIAFWEGEHGILEIFPYLANGNAVIAMSDFNAECYRSDLPKSSPVFKIIYPLMLPDPITPDCQSTRSRYGIDDKAFVVFFNFDLGSAFRKNADGAMRAFAKAFPTEPNARLLYKINGCRKHPEKFAELKRLAADLGISDRFIAVDRYLTQEDLFALTAAADCYLSLHRAEGFGLGIAEAMCFGIPVVVTDYSSTTEFCNRDTSIPIPYKMIPISGTEYFASMKQWAAPDENVAAVQLKRLFDDPELRRRLGAAGKTFVESHFSTAAFRASVESFLAS